MRKWWFALAVVVGLWWGGGQRVEAAPPYQDLLFENVTWSPGQNEAGVIYAPPSELWVVAGTKLPVYFFRVNNSDFTNISGARVVVERLDKGENEQKLPAEIRGTDSDVPEGAVLVEPIKEGDQRYQITTPIAPAGRPQSTMEFKLHVIKRLPENLHLNADGLDIFDFVPFQLFAVDDMGHKYLTQLFKSNEYGKPISEIGKSLVVKANQASGVQTVHIDYGSGLDPLTLSRLRPLIGKYTIVQQLSPINVDQRGQALVKLPVIIPPAENEYVRLFWKGANGEEGAIPIEEGVVQFKDLKPANFPMKWQIEYKGSPFKGNGAETVGVKAYTYTEIEANFIAAQSIDLPAIPLPPLFFGTYTLSQIANGPIAVAPAWQQLDISATGPWTLQVSIKAPPALPMRLRLGAQDMGTGEVPIAITGTDSQPVSLAESRLIIPKMPLLSPGEYAADITFNLIRGPTP